jgi:hypothetical protein
MIIFWSQINLKFRYNLLFYVHLKYYRQQTYRLLVLFYIKLYDTTGHAIFYSLSSQNISLSF